MGLGSVALALALQALAVEPAGSSGAVATADPAAPSAVVQTTEVFEVERVLDAAGMVERRVVPAEDLVAGDELRYLIRLRNTGPARIAAGRIQVRTPVPEGVRFLPGSAGGAGALVEYAVDGVTFSTHVPDQPAEPQEAAAPAAGELSAAPGVPAAEPTANAQPVVLEASAEPPGAAVPAEAGATEALAAESPAAESAAEATGAVAGGGPEPSAAEAGAGIEVAGGPASRAPDSGAVAGSEAVPEAVPEPVPEAVPDEDTAAAAVTTGIPPPALTIRWTYQQALDPGAEAEVFFHVRLL